jgi:hypothetical protein
MVDRESHVAAEAGDRDRAWESSGRRKRTEATGSIMIGGVEAKSVGERMGSGERRGEQMWGATLELRMRAERHIPPIFD